MASTSALSSSPVRASQRRAVYPTFGTRYAHLQPVIVYALPRTPGTGLYDNLQRYNIPYPEAIFELSYFYRNPKPFFQLAKELYPGRYQPNIIHYFIRYLHDQDLLHRVYTQNIDGLERSRFSNGETEIKSLPFLSLV